MQSIHAAIEATRRGHISSDAPHPHLVLCGVPHEDALLAQADRLEAHGVPFERFYEPDRDNELTAIATAPVHGDARRVFRKLQLMKG